MLSTFRIYLFKFTHIHKTHFYIRSTVPLFLSSAAIGVQLADASFPETDFEVVRGNTNVKWARIAPYPLFDIG